jgi:hypothetical protein
MQTTPIYLEERRIREVLREMREELRKA